jgi:hypothetical protein
MTSNSDVFRDQKKTTSRECAIVQQEKQAWIETGKEKGWCKLSRSEMRAPVFPLLRYKLLIITVFSAVQGLFS